MSVNRALLVVQLCAIAACGGEPSVAAPRPAAASTSPGRAMRYRVEVGPRAAGSWHADAGSDSAECHAGQRILVDQVSNARDLGGVSLSPTQSVVCGALYRGPPLAALSRTGCDEFARLGVRTVIDLRIPEEAAADPDSDCVAQKAHQVFAPLPIPYNVSPQNYIAVLDTTASVAAAFAAFGDAAAYPIYFHCTLGRDRTGVLSAVVLLALGATPADILSEYLLSRASVGAYPLSLQAALDEIERRGGIEAYLAAVGVSEDQLATLRAQAVLH